MINFPDVNDLYAYIISWPSVIFFFVIFFQMHQVSRTKTCHESSESDP